MERTYHTTKPFMSGRSQAIRIPKDYRLEEAELIINRIGDSLVITPKHSLQEAFFSGIAMLPEDFLAEGRPEEATNERVIL
ncbi:MAG: AbrB/MazE/SpoVT family DNA-binding domain-containing protein [Clostridia bacterium]|nr:AbrB/MazE/SpoVT family DNA-binding domain-containing protein [Clostridia bacterium]